MNKKDWFFISVMFLLLAFCMNQAQIETEKTIQQQTFELNQLKLAICASMPECDVLSLIEE